MRYFVYVNGLTGPEPQIWYSDLIRDGNPIDTLMSTILHECESGDIDYFTERYPYDTSRFSALS